MSNEAFAITESATGKSCPIRDLTDEQLTKHLTTVQDQHKAATQHVLQALETVTQLAQVAAVLGYEIDRRSRSIIIPR